MNKQMPGLKPLDQISIPDERHRAFANFETLEPITLEQHYAEINAITLSMSVPFEVIEAFDRARNAFLYSWFVYEFSSLAEMQAYATLEMALRIRLKKQTGRNARGLKKLLNEAIAKGIITDPQSDFEGGISYFISTIRNIWGHGTDMLLDPGTTLQALQRSADLINQLYKSH